MKYFFIFFLLFSGLFPIKQSVADTTPLSHLAADLSLARERAQGGTTSWQPTAFGKTRLVSYRTGIRGQSKLLLAVEADTAPNWQIDTPLLDIQVSDATATPLTVFKPDSDNESDWTKSFSGIAFFPIVLEDIQPHDLTIRVQGTWHACPVQGNCQYFTQTYQLTLPESEAYLTNWAAPILNSLKITALPLERTDITAQGSVLSDGRIRTQLTFPKTLQWLSIQTISDSAPTLLSQHIEQNKAVFIWQNNSNNPLTVESSFPFRVRSSGGFTEGSFTLSESSISAPTEEIPFYKIFWACFFFLICTPIWCLWLVPQSLANRGSEMRLVTRQIQGRLAVLFIILGLLWIYCLPIDFVPSGYLLSIVLLLATLLLIVKPIQKEYIMLGLIFLFPKPFLTAFTAASAGFKIALLSGGYVLIFLCFNIWLIAPGKTLSFFRKAQKSDMGYRAILRLPYALMFGWLLASVSAPLWAPTYPPMPDKASPLALVQVATPTCLPCAWDRLTVFRNTTDTKLTYYHLTTGTEQARQIRDTYGLHHTCFNFLILKNGQKMILPRDLSRHQFNQLMKQVEP